MFRVVGFAVRNTDLGLVVLVCVICMLVLTLAATI
jgi:hypothetical protein